MQPVLEYLVKSIVANPDQIVVEKIDDENPSNETYEISVPKDEIGRVIGKNGSVIKAIRTLVSIPLRGTGKFLRLNLKEV